MKFDFATYEFAGIVAPGSVVVFAILALHPAAFHFGDAAVTIVAAVIAAYVFGHLIAAVGNMCEDLKIVDALDAPRLGKLEFKHWTDEKRSYLSSDQEGTLRKLVFDRLKGDLDDPSQLKRIVKQMYTILLEEDHKYRKERLETFNGLYNFSRGLSVAFAVAFMLSAISGSWGAAAFCLVAVGLACYRVRKFNAIYARELVQQFLLLEQEMPF